MEVSVFFILVIFSVFLYFLYFKMQGAISSVALWILVGVLIVMANGVWIAGIEQTYAVDLTPTESVTFYAQNCSNAGNYSCTNSQNTTFVYGTGSQVKIVKQDLQTTGLGIMFTLLAIFLAASEAVRYLQGRKFF